MLIQAQRIRSMEKSHRMYTTVCFMEAQFYSVKPRAENGNSALRSGMAIGIIKMLLNQNFKIELGPTTNSKQFQGNSRRKHFGGKLRT